jgi:hypothetical protein
MRPGRFLFLFISGIIDVKESFFGTNKNIIVVERVHLLEAAYQFII